MRRSDSQVAPRNDNEGPRLEMAVEEARPVTMTGVQNDVRTYRVYQALFPGCVDEVLPTGQDDKATEAPHTDSSVLPIA